MNKFFYSLSLLLFFFLCEELRADTVITEIRTEQLVAPVGIDAPAPRLSWQITSTEGEKCNANGLSYSGVFFTGKIK